MHDIINLKDIFRMIKRRLPIILIFFILAGGLGTLYSIKSDQTIYSSTTSILVGREKEVLVESDEPKEPVIIDPTNPFYREPEPEYETIIEYGGYTIPAQVGNFHKDLIYSSSFLTKIIEKLKLDTTVDKLKDNINVNIPAESGKIEITVSGVDFVNADQVADRIALEFMEDVVEITKVDRMIIMDYADTPKTRNTQNKKMNVVLASGLGLVTGVFLALVLEFFDDRIRREEELEKRFNFNILGNTKKKNKEEAYRNMRTNIFFNKATKDKKLFTLASPSMKNDLHRTSTDLVETIAKANKKVLYIDSNFRQPILDKEYNLSNDKGLSNILVNKASLEDNIRTSDMENLHILTTGPQIQDPAKLLGSENMEGLLKSAKDQYDYIFLRAHPIAEVTDTIALSTYTDGLILFVTIDRDKTKEILKTKLALDKVEVNILGAIVN